MRNWFAISFMIVLLVLNSAFSETIDVALMSFDELETIKHAIDLEYYSRPESSGITLVTGAYEVGKDIKAGLYYASMVKPDAYQPGCYSMVHTNAEEFENYKGKSYFVGLTEDPISIQLVDGNIISVKYGSMLMKTELFDPTEYYSYNPPEGTFVPAGTYIVGEDIPVGNYYAYPATIAGGKYRDWTVVTNADGSTEKVSKEKLSTLKDVYITEPMNGELMELVETDLVEVKKPIIMIKQKKLDFGE